MPQMIEEKMLVREQKVLGFAEGVNESENFNIVKNLPFMEERDFSHVSYGLLKQYGYIEDGQLKRSPFEKLLKQARKIVVNSRRHLGSVEPFLFDQIDIPEGKKRIVLICQNVDGKTSIKLPTELPNTAQGMPVI